MTHCDRCNAKINICTGSYFNEDMICTDCQSREEEHPKYNEAKEAEHRAVLNGDLNFPGIGLPDDF